MDVYKICPTCGKKNAPTMLECIGCETDLSNIPLGEVREDDLTSENRENNMQPYDLVRICDCGTKNPVNVRKCRNCGEDISDVTPVADDKNVDANHYFLSSVDGEYAFAISQGVAIIGRENEMKEYLFNKSFVSRKHAELLLEDGKLWIKNHSKTNHTFVNNTMIRDEEFVELHDGDIIGLGGKEINGEYQKDAAFFLVRIDICI